MDSWKNGKFFQYVRIGHCVCLLGPTRPQDKLEGGSLVLKFGDKCPAGKRTELLDERFLPGAHFDPETPLVALV